MAAVSTIHVRRECDTESANTREATINQIGATPIGAVLFVTAAELERMGVDVKQAEVVVPTVEDGKLRLETVEE